MGMAQAMEGTGLPYIISFMLKKNGRLIDGASICDAIKEIDAATQTNPVCYMTNCIHPQILQKALSHPFNKNEIVAQRFCGIQANTSLLSPEELDHSKELFTSDSICLADDMAALSKHINLKIYGGCCGTTASHMEAIAKRICNK